MKRVQVGQYAYDTNLDVNVGDRVILPTPPWLRDVKGPTFEGTVTALESSYTGYCNKIISVVK